MDKVEPSLTKRHFMTLFFSMLRFVVIFVRESLKQGSDLILRGLSFDFFVKRKAYSTIE